MHVIDLIQQKGSDVISAYMSMIASLQLLIH